MGINKFTSHTVRTLSFSREDTGWPTLAETVLTAAAPVSASGRGSTNEQRKKVEAGKMFE